MRVMDTYSLRSVQHHCGKVPEAQSPIFAYAAEAIVAVVAAPWIKRQRSHPRFVALASRHQRRVGHGPDGNQIILSTGQDILAVRCPCYAGEAAVVRVEEVEKPRCTCQSCLQSNADGDGKFSLFFKVVDDAQGAVFGYNRQVPTVG